MSIINEKCRCGARAELKSYFHPSGMRVTVCHNCAVSLGVIKWESDFYPNSKNKTPEPGKIISEK